MIEISGLNKFYDDRRAVGPLTTSIASGEVVGLLGLNGSGKTTTLRILACDLLPTSGSVRIDGVDVVADQDQLRKTIGYLPDKPPLYDEMTVHEYLRFAARLRGLEPREAVRRADEVCELTEVVDYRDERIGALSHGFRQRVGIAQAVVHRPRLVLLDEPISGLDPVQIVEMRRLVQNLRGEQTVVVSSHILPEISETCDRLLVLRDGRIVATGSERELLERMRAGYRVSLTFRSTDERAEARVRRSLQALEGVEGVEAVGTTEPGEALHSFEVTSSRDCRPELSRAVLEAEVDLVELRRSARELESIFLELSGAGSQQRDPGEAVEPIQVEA